MFRTFKQKVTGLILKLNHSPHMAGLTGTMIDLLRKEIPARVFDLILGRWGGVNVLCCSCVCLPLLLRRYIHAPIGTAAMQWTCQQKSAQQSLARHGIGFQNLLACLSSMSLLFPDPALAMDFCNKEWVLLNRLAGGQATTTCTRMSRGNFLTFSR